nr:hypothetical protein [bacterium]
MKCKIVLFLLSGSLILCGAFGGAVFALAQGEDDIDLNRTAALATQAAQPTVEAFATFQRPLAANQKWVSFQGKRVLVEYESSDNRTRFPLKSDADRYDAFDCYIDKDNPERHFLFLYQTDILCGYADFSVSSDPSPNNSRISHKQAAQIAKDFIDQTLEDTTGYVYEKVEPSAMGDSLLVSFYRSLDGIKTDDVAYVSLRLDGSVEMMTAYHYGRYDAAIAQGKPVNPASARQKIASAMEELGRIDLTVKDEFITYTSQGELALAQLITFTGYTPAGVDYHAMCQVTVGLDSGAYEVMD